MQLSFPASRRQLLVFGGRARLQHDDARRAWLRVIDVAEAEAGLAVLRSNQRIDILFTDVVLPGKSGRVLADEAASIRPELKVLFTTAIHVPRLCIMVGSIQACNLSPSPSHRTDWLCASGPCLTEIPRARSGRAAAMEAPFTGAPTTALVGMPATGARR